MKKVTVKAAVMAGLAKAPATVKQLAVATGKPASSVKQIICSLKCNHLIYVHGWMHQGSGSPAIYALGNLPDAPYEKKAAPKKLSARERNLARLAALPRPKTSTELAMELVPNSVFSPAVRGMKVSMGMTA